MYFLHTSHNLHSMPITITLPKTSNLPRLRDVLILPFPLRLKDERMEELASERAWNL